MEEETNLRLKELIGVAGSCNLVLRLLRTSTLFLIPLVIRNIFSINEGLNNWAISSGENKYGGTENVSFLTKVYLSIPIFQKSILKNFNKNMLIRLKSGYILNFNFFNGSPIKGGLSL